MEPKTVFISILTISNDDWLNLLINHLKPVRYWNMYSIMVCDDNPDFRNLAKHALERNNHDVTTVEGGKEALLKIEEEKPDLLLLDIKMPGLGGWDVLREMHERNIIDETSVAMLTGEDLSVSKMLREEMDYLVDYFEKSLKITELSGAVERVLRKIERMFELQDKILEESPQNGEIMADTFLTWCRVQMIHRKLLEKLKEIISNCYSSEKRSRIEKLMEEEKQIIEMANIKKEEILKSAGVVTSSLEDLRLSSTDMEEAPIS